MRFAIAVLASAIVQVFPYLRLDQWIGVGAMGAFAYIGLAAFGAGFFAARRGALAGGLSVALGALLYALAAALREPGSDPATVVFFLLRIPIAVLPFILVGIVTGWAGGAARTRVLPRAA